MQVGRYQVLETLGVGAQSRVVRGHDPLIDRSVAIKVALLFPLLVNGPAMSPKPSLWPIKNRSSMAISRPPTS